MLDEELRAGLADWVRPVASLPVPDLRVLRRRARRRGMRRAAASAAITAVVAAAAIGITVSLPAGSGAGHSGAGRSGTVPLAAGGPRTWSAAPGTWSRGTWQPAGSLPAPDAGPAAAPYFVTVQARQAAAVVTDAFTGQVMASVRPLRSGQGFAGVAAAGDDHTFVLAARETGAVGFYELRLRPDGREESLSPLFALPVRTVPAFAVSPDASLLAYTTATGMETVSLAEGTGRSWTVAGGQASGLSWAGDTTLAFEWQGLSPSGVQPAGAGVRLLDIASPGTLIQASRLLIPACTSSQVCVGGPLITPDGSKVLATSITLSTVIAATVVEYSARTGQALVTVTPAVTASRGGQPCGPLWTDPSGKQVAAFCGKGFVIDGTRFTTADLHLPAGVSLASGDSLAW
jgi:hypothetical protein